MIRSLTVGLPLDSLSTHEIRAKVQSLFGTATKLLTPRSLSPRTHRFTLPVSEASSEDEGVIFSHLRWVNDLAQDTGVRWFCLPLNLATDMSNRVRLSAALDAITRYDKLFINAIISSDYTLNPRAALDAAKLILDISRKSHNGFDNFRMGASCNCPSNAPFFPFSKHDGDQVAFSFALETTPIAQKVIEEHAHARDVDVIRDAIIEAMREPLRIIDDLGHQISKDAQVEYRGLDPSFAPLPSENISVASLVEGITGMPIGCHGSIFATAFLTDILRTVTSETGVLTVGFNGVMYSVLEDRALSVANNQRRLTLDALLSLATVCACGLDMIPVPGTSFPEELAAVMLDVAALSCAHRKPLGVRLLPIPNGCVNELTQLNLDFLCDSRVIGLIANDQVIRSREPIITLKTPREWQN